MRVSSAHIAGVGVSPATKNLDLNDAAISASTKALLDAGVTYSDVDQSVVCFLDDQRRISLSCPDVFGRDRASICQVDACSALFTAVQFVRSRDRNCVLLLGLDQNAGSSTKADTVAVAFVLVGDVFLTSHAYLKDAGVRIRACTSTDRTSSSEADLRRASIEYALHQAGLGVVDVQIVSATDSGSGTQQMLDALHGTPRVGQQEALRNLSGLPETQSSVTEGGVTGLVGLCELVWQLRGWASDRAVPKVANCLQYTSSTGGGASVVIVARSDSQPAPSWSEIANVREGRERLGYNPAVEMREISREDPEAVRTRRGDRMEQGVKQSRLRERGGDRAALARL